MLHIRRTTQMLGIRPELFPAMLVIDGYFTQEGLDWYITSASDGPHSPGSPHYRGCAIRIDILDAEEEDFLDYANDIQEALSPEYTLTPEISYITLEYSPRKGINL